MRGLKVLLLDKGDIGGGTSSWSTRLIHGGLRYLEHGEFGWSANRLQLATRDSNADRPPRFQDALPIFIPIYQALAVVNGPCAPGRRLTIPVI